MCGNRMWFAVLALVLVLSLLVTASSLPNLHPNQPHGWDYPLVLSTADTASMYLAPISDLLPENPGVTYWSASLRNTGDMPIDEYLHVYLYQDGSDDPMDEPSWDNPLSPPVTMPCLNLRPDMFYAGRHTVEFRIDPDNIIAESDETDNVWAHQYVFEPRTENNNFGTASVPTRTGGCSAVPAGEPLWYNCRAARMQSSGWWNGVVVQALDIDVDLDCRLHAASTGSEDGY